MNKLVLLIVSIFFLSTSQSFSYKDSMGELLETKDFLGLMKEFFGDSIKVYRNALQDNSHKGWVEYRGIGSKFLISNYEDYKPISGTKYITMLYKKYIIYQSKAGDYQCEYVEINTRLTNKKYSFSIVLTVPSNDRKCIQKVETKYLFPKYRNKPEENSIEFAKKVLDYFEQKNF